MKKEIAEAWIKDLRSNPPQTEGVLFDGNGYCCLGRLCVVLGKEFLKVGDKEYEADGSTFTLPNTVVDEAILADDAGSRADGRDIVVGGMNYASLANANDDCRTFAEIADAIERHWLDL